MGIKNQRLLVSICTRSSSFIPEDKERLLLGPPFSALCPTQWGNKLRRLRNRSLGNIDSREGRSMWVPSHLQHLQGRYQGLVLGRLGRELSRAMSTDHLPPTHWAGTTRPRQQLVTQRAREEPICSSRRKQ